MAGDPGQPGIALAEYRLAMPVDRYGSAVPSAVRLKAMQVITLIVFYGFSVAYLGQKITRNALGGFAPIAAGAFLPFRGGTTAA